MKRLKSLTGLAVVILTISLFFYYLYKHPTLLSQLRHVSIVVLLELLVLYACMQVTLVFIYDILLQICQTKVPFKEHALLSMYSSIINFFGPLQSGPGVRAVYLKKRHNVRIRTYAGATFIYYILFAALSGTFLLLGSRPWPQALALLTLAGLVGGFLIFTKQSMRLKNTGVQLQVQLIGKLTLAVLVQVSLISIIYFTELRTIQQVSFKQAITYTGAANFALFVSLTPGALGFRESFLFFSQRLHHIGTNTIVAANVIDRGIYVVFLGLLLLIVLAVHAKDKLRLDKPPV